MNTSVMIVGLGNPGLQYDGTRHNIGFAVLDALAARLGLRFSLVPRLFAHVAEGNVVGRKVVLVKPTTFMNASGDAVRLAGAWFHVPSSHTVVVHDDVALLLGTVRVRKDSGAGGHNGLKSIIAALGSQDFLRVKLGVGEPEAPIPLEAYVLRRFDKEEEETVAQMIEMVVALLVREELPDETTMTVGE